MKKIIKLIFSILIKKFIHLCNKYNFGRYLLDQISKNISSSFITINHNDINIHLSTPNSLNYFRATTFSEKEPETLNWIEQMSEKSIFWDIGANVGLYSIYAAKLRNCEVYAFEPSVFNLEVLSKNIFLNKLTDNITTITLPLTDYIKKNKMNMSSIELGGALSSFGENYGHDGKILKNIFQFSTIGISADDALTTLKIPNPDFLKIDVDGIEELILKGGHEILKNTISVLVEVNDQFTKQKNNVEKILINSGFYLKEKKQSIIFKNSEFDSSYNQIWSRK